MVQGWAAVWSPALLLGKVHGAVKAEEFIARGTGKRGAIILSFGSPKEKKEAEARLVKEDGISLYPAYSSRSTSNSYHRIRTHWSTGHLRKGG